MTIFQTNKVSLLATGNRHSLPKLGGNDLRGSSVGHDGHRRHRKYPCRHCCRFQKINGQFNFFKLFGLK